MKELKKFERPEIRYTEFATNDVITTSGGDDPVKSSMRSAGSNNDNEYRMGFDFDDLLQ